MRQANGIKSARVTAGKRQSDVAIALGISVYTVSAYERGKISPSLDRIREISDFLCCAPEDLLEPSPVPMGQRVRLTRGVGQSSPNAVGREARA